MIDIDELCKIMNYLSLSDVLYDKSVYKYGVYKNILQEIYPRYNDYKIKKVFDELIYLGHIHKVPTNKSFKYQFNSFLDKKKLYADKDFIVYFD